MPADNEPVLLSYDEAVALLPEGEQVHTFLDGGVALLGANSDRTSILQLLEKTTRREVTGPAAQAIGHGLVAFNEDGRPVFIETRREGGELGMSWKQLVAEAREFDAQRTRAREARRSRAISGVLTATGLDGVIRGYTQNPRPQTGPPSGQSTTAADIYWAARAAAENGMDLEVTIEEVPE